MKAKALAVTVAAAAALAVRDTLKTHHICTVPTDRGPCLRIRKAATPEPDVLDLYRRLDISPRIIEPIHTRSDRT